MTGKPLVSSTASSMPMFNSAAIADIGYLHRRLSAPPYVNNRRVVQDVKAKMLAFGLRGEDMSLKPQYLSRVIKVEEGKSWSQVFGNFVGTASAFRAVVETADFEHHGFVKRHDTEALNELFLLLQQYRDTLGQISGDVVSRTMQLSGSLCASLVDELHTLFTNPDYRETLEADGRTIIITSPEGNQFADMVRSGFVAAPLPEGAFSLFNRRGLNAFKRWAERATDPKSFFGGLSSLPDAERIAGRTAVEIDVFGRSGGLMPPHPSYASPVHRVMVALMAEAELNEIPRLEFRSNGWRQAYEARVPTAYADQFLAMVRANEVMGSLRGQHDWWVEKIGEQVSVVIPTQPAKHIYQFEVISKSLLRKVATLFNHLSRLDLDRRIDVDAVDSTGISLGAKLSAFEENVAELQDMRRYLTQERSMHPYKRTQESYAASALIDRLLFILKPYRQLHEMRHEPNSLIANIKRCLNCNAFNLLEHIPNTNDQVPRVKVNPAGPRLPFTPAAWLPSHKLMVRLYQLMVDIAGAFDEDSAHPVNVEVNYYWDAEHKRIVFNNPDGRLIEYFRDLNPDKEPDLVPEAARTIFGLARDAGPGGAALTVDPLQGRMYVRMAVQDSPVPVSPMMSSITAPHPDLFFDL